MVHREIRGQRLAALAALGWLLFTDPLLGLFSRAALVLGVPLLYAYLFGSWAAIVLLIALVAERRRGDPPADTGR
jgi:hypothetical protein